MRVKVGEEWRKLGKKRQETYLKEKCVRCGHEKLSHWAREGVVGMGTCFNGLRKMDAEMCMRQGFKENELLDEIERIRKRNG